MLRGLDIGASPNDLGRVPEMRESEQMRARLAAGPIDEALAKTVAEASMSCGSGFGKQAFAELIGEYGERLKPHFIKMATNNQPDEEQTASTALQMLQHTGPIDVDAMSAALTWLGNNWNSGGVFVFESFLASTDLRTAKSLIQTISDDSNNNASRVAKSVLKNSTLFNA